MNNNNASVLFGFALISSISFPVEAEGKIENTQPNFVWLMAEDVAPQFMGLYNNGKGAQTPNLEQMAREGIIYKNAYSNAPVSSAARSTLITGCYAPRLGASFHRSLKQVPMPEGLDMFPAYLRKAGYYTSNAAKTDYNCFLDNNAWDQIRGKMGDWRNRPDKSQPFFFVRTNAASHESCLHFRAEAMESKKTVHKLSDVNLMPYHPDTRTFRYTYATFYDQISRVDNELGTLMDMLKEDGELDNTFIFYFGDNGGSLPGSKGYTGETGLQVPLVVYIPEKWRDQIPLPVGSQADGFVSFMDFGPTLLHLAGVDIPQQMEGISFLGTDISPEELDKRDVVYGYGDRFDELYACNRTLRKGNLKYSRNFQPYHPKSLFAAYRYKQLAFCEWMDLYTSGNLTEVQKRFFDPQGPEELYDLAKDPYETHNLATDPSYAVELKKMRTLLEDNLLEKNDLGLFPESVWLEEGVQSPIEFGKQSHKRIERLLRTAGLQLLSYKDGKHGVEQALASTDCVERCWALTACVWWGNQASELSGQIEKLLVDPSVLVRSRAAVFLTVTGRVNPIGVMKKTLSEASSGAETLWILNDMAYLKNWNPEFEFLLTENDVPVKCTGTDWRIDYLK